MRKNFFSYVAGIVGMFAAFFLLSCESDDRFDGDFCTRAEGQLTRSNSESTPPNRSVSLKFDATLMFDLTQSAKKDSTIKNTKAPIYVEGTVHVTFTISSTGQYVQDDNGKVTWDSNDPQQEVSISVYSFENPAPNHFKVSIIANYPSDADYEQTSWSEEFIE
jgi:hypothetical protein